MQKRLKSRKEKSCSCYAFKIIIIFLLFLVVVWFIAQRLIFEDKMKEKIIRLDEEFKLKLNERVNIGELSIQLKSITSSKNNISIKFAMEKPYMSEEIEINGVKEYILEFDRAWGGYIIKITEINLQKRFIALKISRVRK